MKCSDLKKYFYPFIDNELSVEQNLEVMEHLNMCARCAGQVEQEREFAAKVRSGACSEQVSESLKASLKAAVLHEAGRRGMRLMRALSLAVAAVALVAIGLFAAPYLFDNSDSSSRSKVDQREQIFVDRMVRAYQFARLNSNVSWQPSSGIDDSLAFFESYVNGHTLPHKLCVPQCCDKLSTNRCGVILEKELGINLPFTVLKDGQGNDCYFTCFRASNLDFDRLKTAKKAVKDGITRYLFETDHFKMLVWKCGMKGCYHSLMSETPSEPLEELSKSLKYKLVY